MALNCSNIEETNFPQIIVELCFYRIVKLLQVGSVPKGGSWPAAAVNVSGCATQPSELK